MADCFLPLRSPAVASRQCRSWGLSKQEMGDLTPGNIIKRCFWGLRWLCLKNQQQHLKKSNHDYCPIFGQTAPNPLDKKAAASAARLNPNAT